MPSMHVPCPQHGLSHRCSGGRAAHWSPSETGEEGRHWCRQPATRPYSGPKTRGGGGTAAWNLERTHRRTWTSRSAVEKRDRVRGHQPMYKYMGSPRGTS